MVTGSGNVGIGTTGPSQKLDVAGVIAVNGVRSIYNPSPTFTGSLFIGNGGQSLAFVSGADGYFNTSVGINALLSNTTGNYNTANGTNALRSNITGLANTANGAGALYSNTTGYGNTADGMGALYSNTTGSSNIADGYNALSSNTTGYQNIALGYNSGRYQADGTTALQTANNSVYIGYNARGFNNSDSNSIVIGASAVGIGANSVVLGNNSIVTTALNGNVGIGTTVPGAKLEVVKNGRVASFKGNINNDVWVDISNENTTAGYANLRLNKGASTGLALSISNSTNEATIGTWTAGWPLIFVAGSSIGEKMRITSTGDVGIGTPTPANKLDIEGGMAVGATYSGTYAAPTNGMVIEGSVGIGTKTPAAKMHVSGGDILLDDNYSIKWGGGSAGIKGENPNNKLYFITANSERITIDNIGNVGIGTSAGLSITTLHRFRR